MGPSIYYNPRSQIDKILLKELLTTNLEAFSEMKTISLQYNKAGYNLWDFISVLMATILAKVTAIAFLLLTPFSKNPDGTFSDFLTILILTLGYMVLGSRPQGQLLSPRSKGVITGFFCYILATLIGEKFSLLNIDYVSIILFIKVALSFFLYGLGLLFANFFKKII
jgi:hypothetical protein